MNYYSLFSQLKKECLIIDIETWAEFSNGNPIDIKSQFEQYLESAQVKWFGAYSYFRNMYYIINVKKSPGMIKHLLNSHNTLIGFNSKEFDYPILKNNGFISIRGSKFHKHIDCMEILGKSVFFNKQGYRLKNRGELMGYKFKNNSMRSIAKAMNITVQKGEIDYELFKKDIWTIEEENLIKIYLKNDIQITKQMFEKLWDFWSPFTELLKPKFIKDFSWIKNSIASLTYKAACSHLNIDPSYSESTKKQEQMGGNVLLPKYEEARNVWYVDFASLYPHIFCMFNLFSELNDSSNKENCKIWHGNDLFKVKGYYNINKQHKLNTYVQTKLKERINLKQKDPKNPLIYTIKIFLNGLYGVIRSPIFEQLHTPNAGWDCCWLGQQIQKYVIDRMKELGFESVYGDTDSVMMLTNDLEKNNRTYVKECLSIIIKEINMNVPFPIKTFNIDIEHFINYILFPFSLEPIKDENGNNIKENNRLIKKLKGKKKNYLYIHDNEIELVGLPIKKDNATKLGIKIYEEVLKEKILNTKSAKFSYILIKQIINEYVKKHENLPLLAQEYKIKPLISYKLASQLQAQISKEYLNGEDGIIRLIKNKKTGKVGKGTKYCTIEEAKQNNLTEEDFDLKKVWNELSPFIDNKTIPMVKKVKRTKTKKTVAEVPCDFKRCKQNKNGVCLNKHEIEDGVLCPKNNEQSVYEDESLLKECPINENVQQKVDIKENKTFKSYYEE